jgi:hypothetical protein
MMHRTKVKEDLNDDSLALVILAFDYTGSSFNSLTLCEISDISCNSC